MTGFVSERASALWPKRVEEVYRSDSRRVFASLIRLLGDFDLAEDELQGAFAAALGQWPKSGAHT